MRAPFDYTITCNQCSKAHVPFSYDNAAAWMQTHECGSEKDPYD